MQEIMTWLVAHSPRFAVRPRPFGVFHLVAVGLLLAVSVLMLLFRRKLPRGEVALRRLLVIFGVGLLLLEIGKQVVYAYTPDGGWVYNWDRFPFQFCSVPIYVALVGMCLPDNRLRRAILSFLATYSPVAGCAVLLYPAPSVFHEVVFLNVHTMVWHGVMLLFGLYLWLTGAVRPTPKTAMGAACVYLPMPPIACLLNEWEHATGFAGDFTFNMFYISRFGNCPIPLLSFVQDNAPYAVFFASYVLLLGAGGALVVAGVWVATAIGDRLRKRELKERSS